MFSSNEALCNPIDLSTAELNISLGDYYIKDVKITRKDKTIAGINIEGRKIFSFKNGIELQVLKMMQHNYPKEDKQPLTLVVHYLGSLVSSGCIFTELSLSFCKVDEEGNITELLRTGTLEYYWRRIDRDDACHNSIVKAFQTCFNDFSYRLTNNSLNTIVNNNIFNEAPAINKENFPILKNNPKRGVIHTLSSFIDNKIDTTIHFLLTQKGRTVNNSRLFHVEIPKKQIIWGICDGKRYYKKIGDWYFPIDISGDKVFIHTEGDALSGDDGRHTGGFIGYVLFDEGGLVTRDWQINKEFLNLYSGRVFPVKEKYEFILDYKEKGFKNRPVYLLNSNKDTIVRLESKQYVRYPYSPFDLIVCLDMVSDNLKLNGYLKTICLERIITGRMKKYFIFYSPFISSNAYQRKRKEITINQ